MMTKEEMQFCNGRAAGKTKRINITSANFEALNRELNKGIIPGRIAIFVGKPRKRSFQFLKTFDYNINGKG